MSTNLIPFPNTQPPALRDEERAQLREAFVGRHAEGTRDKYAGSFRRFTEWCMPRSFDALPAAPETIALYCTELAKAGKSVSYIRVNVAAIAAAHHTKFPGMSSPTDVPLVSEILMGISKTYGKPKKKKKGATSDILLKMVEKMPRETMKDRRDVSLILVGFALASRRSEVASLRLQYIEKTDRGLLITIPKSKGDQKGQGQQVAITRIDDTRLCAVTALESWIAEAKPVDYVFAHSDGKPVSGEYVARLVKRAAEAAGYDPDLFAGHSLRRGHITQAYKNGAPLEVIKRQSRHVRDETLYEYIEEVDKVAENSSQYLTPRKK